MNFKPKSAARKYDPMRRQVPSLLREELSPAGDPTVQRPHPFRDGSVALMAGGENPFAQEVLRALHRLDRGKKLRFFFAKFPSGPISATSVFKTCIYVPSFTGRDAMTPDLREAGQVLTHAATLKCDNFILLSSALVYGTGCGRPGLVKEGYSPPADERGHIAQSWSNLEDLATQNIGPETRITILRPVTVVPSPALLNRLLKRHAISTLVGYDPVLQLLSLSDLAQAIDLAIQNDVPGTFNVAPDTVVPLHAAIRLAGGIRVPVPHTVQRIRRRKDVLQYLRYPWTVSNEKIKKELGFHPAKSSGAALLDVRATASETSEPHPRSFDAFGMDRDYIEFYGKTLFRFLCNYYWRIETTGLEHIPLEGPGLLVGTHRGFMPFDGVMSLHILVNKIGRAPRFLTHPALFKWPFLANFMTKLGGVVACQDTADHVLQSRELVGIFPEGIHGAFTYYRDAYKIQGFGRDAFVKMALRNRAPIIPYVILGSAETFPLFGKIHSKLWSGYTEWPCLPLTPTFPFLPVPLPSKWHLKVLPPIHTEQYGPEAVRDRSLIKSISAEVRKSMQDTLDDLRRRRKRIFWGSIFDQRER